MIASFTLDFLGHCSPPKLSDVKMVCNVSIIISQVFWQYWVMEPYYFVCISLWTWIDINISIKENAIDLQLDYEFSFSFLCNTHFSVKKKENVLVHTHYASARTPVLNLSVKFKQESNPKKPVFIFPNLCLWSATVLSHISPYSCF